MEEVSCVGALWASVCHLGHQAVPLSPGPAGGGEDVNRAVVITLVMQVRIMINPVVKP